MNLTSPSEVKQLLTAMNCAPRKAAGQNFLIDRNIRDIVLRAADVQPGEMVLEIGPGLGVLTEELLKTAERVYAVEIDAALHKHLYECFAENERLVLIHADATRINLADFLQAGVTKLISNLPYSVGSRILYEMASPSATAPESMTVMLQRDVAERIMAPVGGKQYGLLTVWLQMFYSVRIVKHVNASCFYPRPQVGSSVVHFTRRESPQFAVNDWSIFERFIKHCFTQRRKQLATILKTGPVALRIDADTLIAAGLLPEIRPEQIDVATWGRISALCAGAGQDFSMRDSTS